MCIITYFTERNQIQIKKKNLRNLILKYDVIHNALIAICNRNFKLPRYFGDIGTDRNLA